MKFVGVLYIEEIMEQSLQGLEQRKKLKQEITEFIENTLSARILKTAGLFIQRIARRTKPTPWYISAIFLEILAITPQTILAFILRDLNQVIGNGLFWSTAALLVTIVVPLTYLSSKYILSVIRDYIVEAIKTEDQLNNLRNFLLQLTDQKTALFNTVITSLIWCIIAIPAFSFINRSFIGISFSFDTGMFGVFALGIGLNYLIWFMRLPNQLRKYQYNLYQLNPSKSEIIFHISNIFTHPFFATAIYLAICTLVGSLFRIFNWVVPVIVIIFWIPLILHFINSQSAINKIIGYEKWQTLNDIQQQIHERKSNIGFTSSEEIETISKLMDLYERVYSSRNTVLTISSIFILLNQLFLPLLTFLITNYQSVMKLFKLSP